ncbi:hypothetical protein GW17_00040021 [Ensete ventricosum]|nr:hypothetical protein GW17_00040021 [Ensete ventricosum]RZS24586.1 hypothetical protein BHM03_00057673 [Ensete ventricosum]
MFSFPFAVTISMGQSMSIHRSNNSLNVHHDIILRYSTSPAPFFLDGFLIDGDMFSLSLIDTLRLQQDQEQQYCHANGLHSCLAIYHLCILEVSSI